MVSPSKGIYKCFGCGKAGTVIDAVSFFEGVGTGEAIRILSGKIAQVEVEHEAKGESLSLKKKNSWASMLKNWPMSSFGPTN
jgi:DNA primase